MSLWARYKFADREYYLDDSDIVWLAKSLWGECGRSGSQEDRLAVAFCMMQRYLRWPRSHQKWPFWKDLIRAFSQPVNPIWAHPSAYRRRKYPNHCTPARIRRRKRIQLANWSEIPLAAKEAALLFGVGLANNPVPEAVNFGAKGLIRRQKKTGINYGGNVFIDETQDDTVRWIPGELEIII